MSSGSVSKSVRAWDVPTRVFHWTLVALIILAPLTANSGDPLMTWHKRVGYAILVAVLWRLMWGFAGGSTARFSHFFPWPWRVASYLRAVLQGAKPHYLGHNPLGSVMILLLLAAAASQGIAGLFTTDGVVTAGPLYPLASGDWNKLAAGYHAWGFIVILSLAGVHIVANIAYSIFTKDNLIGAMVVGTKESAEFVDQPEATGGSIPLAVALLVLSAAIVLGGIWIVGGDFAAGPSFNFG